MTIVGVVGNVLQAPDAEAKGELYVPASNIRIPSSRMYQNYGCGAHDVCAGARAQPFGNGARL
jgi:hypothetical protein